LTIYDVDLPNRTVRVLGKGRKERVLPIGKHAAGHLRDYLQHGRPKLLKRRAASQSGSKLRAGATFSCSSQPTLTNQRPKETIEETALWLSHNTGEPLFADGVTFALRKLGKQAGLPQALTCHVFRRTCATAILRNGAHPEMVKTMLGHSSLKSLAQYLRVTIQEIKRMHAHSKPGR
jgi:site-specific recombinase XerD